MAVDARPAILFYDGECGLCDKSVRWVMRHDHRRRFRFAPLQGETYRELAIDDKPTDVNTMVLLEAGRLHTRSSAAIRVLRALGGPWAWLASLARLVPRPLRDAVYNAIAARRHRWFGGPEACQLPTAAERAQLLP